MTEPSGKPSEGEARSEPSGETHSHEGMFAGDDGVPYNLTTASTAFDALDGLAPDGPIDEVFDHEAFDTNMDAAGLMAAILSGADSAKAGPMAAYMKGKFAFLGITSDARRILTKPYFAEAKNDSHPDWSFVSAAWASPFREFQYVAVDYLEMMASTMSVADFPRLRTLVESKSWWDSVDALRKVVGVIFRADIESGGGHAAKNLLEWADSENMWTRRVAVTAQLGWKKATDTELLGRILRMNFGSHEFFINKAIGWALRDFSKADPNWVRDFIDTHREKMDALSIREGSKYI